MVESSEFVPSQLPNPFTPMAFLPPELAYQQTMRAYVLIGVLGVLTWDILANLGADYELLTRYRFSLPTVIYYLSRWSSVLYSVCSVIFETAQVGNCVTFSKVTCAIYHPAVSATALLFFFRVRALYGRNKYITGIFFVMWLAVLGASLTVITSLLGAHIGNTKYCTVVKFQPYRASSNIAITVFDTCVYVAISWRLLANAPPAGNNGSTGRFDLFGKYLPRFSRALLQDGQNYYMVAMVCNLVVLIMIYVPGIPNVYRPLFFVPSVGLTNMMACRVFRNTKFGTYDEQDTTGTLSIMFTQSRHTITTIIPVHSRHVQSTVHTINRRELHASDLDDTDFSPSVNIVEKLPQLSKEVSAV